MPLQPSLLPGPATLAPFSTHPSQLDTPVPLQPLCYQSHPHAFRHPWGCASVFTSDFELSTRYRSFRSVRINIIPNALASLCFHTLTHSFATRKTLTPAFSIVCALFAENTRGGGSCTVSSIPFCVRQRWPWAASSPWPHSSSPTAPTSPPNRRWAGYAGSGKDANIR